MTEPAPTRQPTVLAYRALGLGDILTCLPALRALRQGLPGHQLVVATPEALHPLLFLAGCADDVVAAEELAPLRWGGARPRIAVNLHGCGPQSHRLLAALRPGRLVAYACPAARHDGPRWDDGEPEVARWARLVEEGLGIPVDREDRYLEAPYTLRPGVVVIHPGASDPARRWPADRYAAVARRIVRTGADIAVTGSDDEADLVERVVSGGGLPPEAGIAGKLDIVALTALVASAKVVIGNDSGVGHLATALRTPSVLLFGPTSPDRWGPPPHPRHHVVWEPGVAARDLDADPVAVTAAALEVSLAVGDPAAATQTTDTVHIRAWVESRGGRPVVIPPSRHPAELARPSVAFVDDRPDMESRSVSWEEWFQLFHANQLCLRYREWEPDGSRSRWFQIRDRRALPDAPVPGSAAPRAEPPAATPLAGPAPR